MSDERFVYVLGTAFFAPRYESIAHAMRDEPREPIAPPFAIAVGRLRRFTSLTTQLQLEVAGRALADADVSPSTVRSVFSSALGELETANALLAGLMDDGAVSPARFVQSVHNTAAGLFSIATGNRNASESLSAGPSTFAAALEEAYFLALESSGPVLVTCADDAAPAILGSRAPGIALATAFVLAAESASPRARLTLRTPASDETVAQREEAPPHLRGSVVFPAMRVADEIARGGNVSGLRIDGHASSRPVVASIVRA